MVPAVTSKRTPAKKAIVKYLAGTKAPVKAPVKDAGGKTGPKVPVFVDGELAMNRHYLIPVDLADAAAARALKEGWSLAEVLRTGFDQYVKGVRRRPAPVKDPLVTMSPEGLQVLSAAFKKDSPAELAARAAEREALRKEGDLAGVKRFDAREAQRTVKARELQNRTLASFHHAGWPLRTLADALVAGGWAKTMTRQAVSLRVMAVGTKYAKVRGVVAPSGPRRTLTATKKKPHVELKDVGVRVSNDVYDRAKIRARSEGAQMSALCEDILDRYVSGKFKMPKRRKLSAVK